MVSVQVGGNIYFYPRSPCGERRVWMGGLSCNGNFYPRSPCGERLWPGLLARPFFLISIHALLAESDTPARISSRLPLISIHALLAESDTWARGSRVTYVISIHALLAESDRLPTALRTPHHNFYPRSPCGERPPVRDIIQWEGIFLSTLSLRRAT